MDFLGDANVASALDVIFFVREIMETNPKLRGQACACLSWTVRLAALSTWEGRVELDRARAHALQHQALSMHALSLGDCTVLRANARPLHQLRPD